MGVPGLPGPQGPPGPPGKDADCNQCPINEAYLVQKSLQCPTVCRKTALAFLLSIPEPLIMILNNTDVETCLKICLGNVTEEFEQEIIETSTESAYIEGAVAHCKLQSVGRPVFHSHATTYYGSWMRDAYPRTGDDMMKRYLMNHFQGIEIVEYRTEADLRREHINNVYRLPYVFDGTNHLIFNGSLFFHRAGFPRIGKFELPSGHYDEIEMPGAAYHGNNYLFNNSMNYFDLAIDENALWVMFHYENEDFLSVAKVDINNLTIYEMFNLTLINHTEIANGIVICGMLYTIDDAHRQRTYISTGYDFYRLQYSKPNIRWINLYENANMISYNPYDKRIYVYDHGYLLTVPAHIQWLSK
uniref:Olfactomedin-like domain-containing protein n=1 Tax=Angiostrongylus cantonensis TaxID=6313 RepID=A0A0K0DC82_ANGCA